MHTQESFLNNFFKICYCEIFFGWCFFFRDGSAIELVGLCKSVVSWLGSMYEQKHFRYDGVTVNNKGTSNLYRPFTGCHWYRRLCHIIICLTVLTLYIAVTEFTINCVTAM